MAEEKASTIEINEELTVLNGTTNAEAATEDVITTPNDSLDESVFAVDEKTKLNSEVMTSEEQNDDTEDKKKDEEESDSVSSEQQKKPKKPLSPAMQRLTAAKRSPDENKKLGPSADERKAKAEQMRKSKISEHRGKEDDKRAAVWERKKRLEEAERAKKEALLKKITTDTAPKNKQASMKRYSASTSNLTLLKKNKVEKEVNIDIGEGGEKAKPKTKVPERPSSSFSRTRPASSGNLLSKSKVDNKPEGKRPMTAEPKKPITSKTPSSRLSLNPRPASALDTVSTDRRKTLPPKQAPVKTSGAAVKLTKPKPTVATVKTVKKAEPVKKLAAKTEALKKDLTLKTPEKSTAEKKTPKTNDKAAEKPENKKRPPSATKKDNSKTTGTPKKSTAPKSETGKNKKQSDCKPTADSSTNQMTEEEAKKALQERRKKAKEEAEAKAKAEREKDELEKQRREEEERRLAEQLKEEEERQAALLEQLKAEEEERKQKMVEEREQREKEEKERLGAEAKQRDEEIQRKAKIEAEKIQKEQQKKEQESEAERTERKKRVELIMARVSANRSASGSTDSPAKSPSNEESAPVDLSQPESLSPPLTTATRQKVDGILRSKGLGKSLEDLLSATSKDEKYEEVPDDAAEPENEINEALTSKVDVIVNTQDTENNVQDSNCVETPIEVEPDVPMSSESEGLINIIAPVSFENKQLVKMAVFDESTEPITDDLKAKSVTVVVDNGDVIDEPIVEKLVDDASPSSGTTPTTEFHLNNNNNNSSCSNELAWTENLDTPTNEQKPSGLQVESSETVEQKVNELDNISSEIVVSTVMEEKPNEASLTNGSTPLIETDLSHTTEVEQWGEFEVRMKQLNDQPINENVVSNEESKLWKVAEGKVELSECF